MVKLLWLNLNKVMECFAFESQKTILSILYRQVNLPTKAKLILKV